MSPRHFFNVINIGHYLVALMKNTIKGQVQLAFLHAKP